MQSSRCEHSMVPQNSTTDTKVLLKYSEPTIFNSKANIEFTKMVAPNKFRGVGQRQWGSWVSEIRHPLLKKRIWLGTFETAEAAARAYDEAAIILSGQKAKTNFPILLPRNHQDYSVEQCYYSPPTVLGAKLRRSCCRDSAAPSVTCLRLDNDNSKIGVWQKQAGRGSPSKWVMKVELLKHAATDSATHDHDAIMDEEKKVAVQMVEELLDGNALC